MIKKISYYSIIIIFIIIACLPIYIADASTMSRSFVWHLLLIAIACYNITKLNKLVARYNSLISSINVFFAYLLIYNLIWLLSGATGIVYYIISVTSWVVCANLFYKIGMSNENKRYMLWKIELSELMKWLTILLICFTLFRQFTLFTKVGFIFNLEAGYGVGGTDVQLFKNIYPFVLASLSIGLFLVKKKSWIYILISLIIIGILISNKRGPLVGMAIAMLITILLQGNIKNKIKIAFLSLIFLLIAIYLAVHFFPELTGSFIRRFTEEDEVGSGRLVVWSEGFHIWNESVNQLFGGGPGYSSKLMMRTQWGAGLNSHSDYMDVLFQYGYLGLILQLVYCIKIVKIIMVVRKDKQFQYKNMLIYSGSFILVTMAYTMTYLYIVAIISSVFFFYTFGKYNFYRSK